jgi:tetratricopeptide (TPR) repeat protein
VSGYARSLEELGEVAAASDVLGRALLDPAPAAGLALQRAALLEELGRLEEALEAWERAARDEPGSAPAHAGRGRVLLLLGRPEEALEAARVAVRLAPDARAGYELLAAAALELTGVEDYYLGLAAVADRFPVEPAYLVDVVRAGVAAGTEAADLERYLARAVERDPQCVDAWRLWGALLVSRGEPQAAADKLARALELEPTDTETLLRLAELYRALGDAARLGAITDHGLSFVTDAGLRAKLERLRAAPH